MYQIKIWRLITKKHYKSFYQGAKKLTFFRDSDSFEQLNVNPLEGFSCSKLWNVVVMSWPQCSKYWKMLQLYELSWWSPNLQWASFHLLVYTYFLELNLTENLWTLWCGGEVWSPSLNWKRWALKHRYWTTFTNLSCMS